MRRKTSIEIEIKEGEESVRLARTNGAPVHVRVRRLGLEADDLRVGEEPERECPEEADVRDFVRRAAGTYYHPAGTCRMGVGADAVVDPELRVRGIDGLRVADASIMPTLTSGNTNAPCIMIGEKCSDMVLAAAETRRVAA